MPFVTSVGKVYTLEEVENDATLKAQLDEQSDSGRNVTPYMEGHILRYVGVSFLLPNLKKKGQTSARLKIYLTFLDENTGDNITMSPDYPFKKERDVETNQIELWGGDLRNTMDKIISATASNRALAKRFNEKLLNTRWRVDKHPINIARIDANGIRRTFDSQRTTFHREADYTPPTASVTGGGGAAGAATGGDHTRRAPKGDTLA